MIHWSQDENTIHGQNNSPSWNSRHAWFGTSRHKQSSMFPIDMYLLLFSLQNRAALTGFSVLVCLRVLQMATVRGTQVNAERLCYKRGAIV